MLCHVPLILPGIHILEFGCIMGRNFNLLGNLAASMDPTTLYNAEEDPEIAFFCFEPTLQGFDHFPGK